MKLRLLALSVALLTFNYAAPWCFSRDNGNAPSDKGSSGSTAQSGQAASARTIEPADPDKVKHNGGKTDVNAIGDRNVGCKTGLGNWYGVEKQIALGKQYAQQVESTVKLIQDPVITEYVNRVGQNIVRNSDAQVPFTIKVIDSEEINAFALPGIFLAASIQPMKRLEVFSGVDTRNKDKNEIAITIAALRTFENDIRTKYNFPLFTLTVKEETRQARMLHGRYLLTDQVGIVMERGFDLLMDDQAMKDIGLDPTKHIRRIQDCLLTHCPDASKVEQLVRTLRDLT